jgi:hypothetical protein
MSVVFDPFADAQYDGTTQMNGSWTPRPSTRTLSGADVKVILSPSPAGLLTGRYPYHTSFQTDSATDLCTLSERSWHLNDICKLCPLRLLECQPQHHRYHQPLWNDHLSDGCTEAD